MRAIEITGDDLQDLIKNLPPELKEKLEALVDNKRQGSGIKILRQFVEQYEDDDVSDHIMAHTLSNVFAKCMDTVKHVIKDKKKEGKKARISTIEMGIIVIEVLKKEAEYIEKALDEHDKECDRGQNCGAKH